MRVLKQYPQISFLIIFSLGTFSIGVCLAIFDNLSFKMYQHDRPSMTISYPSHNESLIPRPADDSTSNSTKPAVSVIKEIGKTKAKYYSHTGTTIYETSYLPVCTGASSRIMMQAYLETQSKEVYSVDKIYLRLVPEAGDNRYIADRTFKIFLDGQLLFNKQGALETSAEDKDKVLSANSTQEIPYKLFVSMTTVKKVQMQFGPTFFGLKESDVEAFRDLLKILK